YIDNVELDGWDGSSDAEDEKRAGAQHCEDVLRTCVNVATLKIYQNIFTDRFLRALWTTGGGGEGGSEVKDAAAIIAGEGDAGADADDGNEHQPTGSMSLLSTRTLRTAGRKKKTGKNRFFRDGPRLAIFSDYLMTLVLTLDHMSSEYIMHWLGLAARNGRLQSLKTVRLCGEKRKKERYLRHKEPRLRLSLLLLFLRSLPRLKHFMLGQGDIYDDIPDAVVDAVIAPPPEEYIKRPAAAEPETTSPSWAHSRRRGRSYAIPLETLNIFGLKVDKGVASDITEKQWAWFFEGNAYGRISSSSSLKLTLAPPDEATVPTTTTTTKASGGLSLNFGYSSVHSITDKIAKTISQSPVMSHQLTGLTIHRASNLSYIGTQALLYGCPNLRILALEHSTISGTLFQNSAPWACRNTLSTLSLFNLDMGNRVLEFAVAARHHIRQLPELKYLSLGGKWVIADMVMDTSPSSEDMARGAGRNDAMVWSKMTYFSLQCPQRYVTLPEFKVMLTMFPVTTHIELWAFNENEVDDWISIHRPDLEYIRHSCDYYG
ncbi:hypothetical protein BG015_010976, partial [Linnemannia schmuckeri]